MTFTAPDAVLTLLANMAALGGFTPVSSPLVGWYGKSVSQHATKDGQDFWLQLRRPPYDGHLAWLASNDIVGVTKPRLLSHDIIVQNDEEQHFLVFDYTTDRTVSGRAWPTEEITLDVDWWQTLHDALERVQQSGSDHASPMNDDFVLPLLKEHFDYIPARPLRMHPVQGDLHWGNIGRKHATLYDWELFGLGPYGYDVALLYFYSYDHPSLKAAIERVFAKLFDEDDFYVSLLFTCAAVLRIMPKYPMLEPFQKTVDAIAPVCLQRLNGRHAS